MLSIPSQQMTRALEEHPERITEAEKAEYVDAYDAITEYDFAPDDTTWYWSQSEISDVAKARLDQSHVKGSLPAYLATYISLGVKCPGSYTDAFLMNTLGFWYPLKAYPDPRMYHPYVEYSTNMANVNLFNWNGELTSTEGCSLFPGLKARFDSFMSEAGWSDIPVLSIFLKSGFAFLMFVFLSLVAFAMRRSDMLFAFAFCGGFVITLLLAPVCLFRYVYPLLISLPALALVLLSGTREGAPTRALCGQQ